MNMGRETAHFVSDSHIPLFVILLLIFTTTIGSLNTAVPLSSAITTRQASISVSLDSEGVNGKTCFPFYRPYNLTVEVKDLPPGEVTEVRAILFPSYYDILFVWNRSTGSFKVNSSDEGGYVIFGGANVLESTPLSLLSVTFYITFTWNWTYTDYCDLRAEANTTEGDVQTTVTDAFRVKGTLFFSGNLKVRGEMGEEIFRGEWVPGNYSITFSGIRLRYEDPSVYVPPTWLYTLTLNCSETGQIIFEAPVDGWVNITTITPLLTAQNVTYRIGIEGMAAPHLRSEVEFLLNVDSTPPNPVQNLKMHPDSPTDTPSSYDNDLTVFLSWESGGDVGSGVGGFLLGIDDGPLNISAYSRMRINLPHAGWVNITVAAVDRVGNLGEGARIEVLVDNLAPVAEVIEPFQGVWYNTTYIKCEVHFYDVGGSGLDESSLHYSCTSGNTGPSWKVPQGAYFENGVLIHYLSNLTEGRENYVMWQISDNVGNLLTTEPVQIFVDTQPPTFANPRPSSDVILHTTKVTFKVDIEDPSEGSGINTSTIQYRYSIEGITGFSPWLPVENLTIYSQDHITVEVSLNLTSSYNNFVQFRAKDIAGNGWALSSPYQIKINTAPIIVVDGEVVGGDTGPSFELREGDDVSINASGTFDPDGDHLIFVWRSDKEGVYPISSPSLSLKELKAGDYNITLVVDDGHGNRVSVVFPVKVLPAPARTEKESIVDRILDLLSPPELYYLLIIIVIVVSVPVVLSGRKSKKTREVKAEKEKEAKAAPKREETEEEEEVSFDVEEGGEEGEEVIMEVVPGTAETFGGFPFGTVYGSKNYAQAGYSTAGSAGVDLSDEFDFDYDLYDVLGVTPDATEEEIKSAYRRLAAKYHPDRAFRLGVEPEESREMMIRINKAKEILLNPEKRALYDQYRESTFTVED